MAVAFLPTALWDDWVSCSNFMKELIFLAILIATFNSISELSNQGKLRSSDGWGLWWDEHSWNNKNLWYPLFGFYKWSWWPLIIFTDAFHFFKTLWVITMCFLPLLEWDALTPVKVFVVYSCTFEIVYTLFPYEKKT